MSLWLHLVCALSLTDCPSGTACSGGGQWWRSWGCSGSLWRPLANGPRSESVTDTQNPPPSGAWRWMRLQLTACTLVRHCEPECVQIPNPQEMCDTVGICSFKLLSSGTICYAASANKSTEVPTLLASMLVKGFFVLLFLFVLFVLYSDGIKIIQLRIFSRLSKYLSLLCICSFTLKNLLKSYNTNSGYYKKRNL